MPEPGVIRITPTTTLWYLDKEKKLPISRRGFTVASAFSGTAHSFAGHTLPAAWVDALPWNYKPERKTQLCAYMSLSRVSHIDDLFLTQPFAPQLFEQGDLPGPSILLGFLTGKLDAAAVQKAWAVKAVESKRDRGTNWEDKMPLLCRGCSERQGTNIYKPLRDLGFVISPEDQCTEIVSLGMDRMCRVCTQKPISILASAPIADVDVLQTCKWCRIKKTPTANDLFCDGCCNMVPNSLQDLTRPRFSSISDTPRPVFRPSKVRFSRDFSIRFVISVRTSSKQASTGRQTSKQANKKKKKTKTQTEGKERRKEIKKKE